MLCVFHTLKYSSAYEQERASRYGFSRENNGESFLKTSSTPRIETSRSTMGNTNWVEKSHYRPPQHNAFMNFCTAVGCSSATPIPRPFCPPFAACPRPGFGVPKRFGGKRESEFWNCALVEGVGVGPLAVRPPAGPFWSFDSPPPETPGLLCVFVTPGLAGDWGRGGWEFKRLGVPGPLCVSAPCIGFAEGVIGAWFAAWRWFGL